MNVWTSQRPDPILCYIYIGEEKISIDRSSSVNASKELLDRRKLGEIKKTTLSESCNNDPLAILSRRTFVNRVTPRIDLWYGNEGIGAVLGCPAALCVCNCEMVFRNRLAISVIPRTAKVSVTHTHTTSVPVWCGVQHVQTSHWQTHWSRETLKSLRLMRSATY